MAATRRAQSVQIFQDPVAYDNQPTFADSTEAAVYRALAPLSDVSRNQQGPLQPTYHYPNGISPVKPLEYSTSTSPATLHNPQFGSVIFHPPQPYMLHTDSPLKKQAVPPYPTPYLASTPLPHMMDQENMYALPLNSAKPQSHMATFEMKAPLKRSLLDSTPLASLSSNVKRHKKHDSAPSKPGLIPLPSSQLEIAGSIELPDPSSFPPMEDVGSKPQFSYAQLIGMSILRAPNRRLTLASIYKWISDNFSFYQATDSGWQNSIRHNLSLNKAFIKQERPKDDPGKGNYWAIKPGCEAQFLKDKPKRLTDPNQYLQSVGEPTRPATASGVISQTLPSPILTKVEISKFADETELSSDATIPASDPAIHDGIEYPQPEVKAEAAQIHSSPPPADIRSSPPPGAQEHVGTPPRVPAFPSGSRSGARKRKLSRVTSGMVDSGYYSSIESSATRNRGHILTSEADIIPAKRRGRAEEEIARIRSSSYDSPSKSVQTLQAAPREAGFPSSSPFRPFDNQAMPLTPPVVFKKPARPIVSVSPGTNLRNHRDRVKKMLASPEKSMFAIGQSPLRAQISISEFDAYLDVENTLEAFLGQSPAARGSPEKRSIKRPRLERAATTSGVLADITGANMASAGIPSPYRLMKPDWHAHTVFGSPGSLWQTPVKKTPKAAPTSHPKVAHNIPTLQLQTEDDFLFGIELPSDSSEPGFDIMQDFQKIGAGSNLAAPNLILDSSLDGWSGGASPSRNPTSQSTGRLHKAAGVRPGLGRCLTSNF